MAETGYNKGNYAPAELRAADAKYAELAPQLERIRSARTREEKLKLAGQLAEGQRQAITKDPGVIAPVVFTIVSEKLFRANEFVALSENDKLNMRAGKAFFGNFKAQFMDYFFTRASMKGFEPGILATDSELLVKFAQEDPVFRKSLVARMETVFLSRKGKPDSSVAHCSVMAPLVKATELLPTLRRLQSDPGAGAGEKELLRVTVQAIEKEAQPARQAPLKR
jgi:hypothetical protein